MNWARGEPNDAGGTWEERYLQMWGVGTVAPGQWNDDANDRKLQPDHAASRSAKSFYRNLGQEDALKDHEGPSGHDHSGAPG